MPPGGKRINSGSPRPQVNVLFTCVGRRIELVDAFRRAASALDIDLQIHGADINWQAPAMHVVDHPHILPPIKSPGYIKILLTVVRQSKIDLLIPSIDPDLPLLAATADGFAKFGCRVLVSSQVVVDICKDKILTYNVLRNADIDTPRTWPWAKVVARRRHRFPFFLKPRRGSAAVGNYVVRDLDELRTFGRRVPDAIVQEFVSGTEHTLDVYCGFDSVPRCVVPRKRLEVRSGEVSKAIIVKDPAIMAVGRRVAQTLGECRGVVTVQCMVTPRGRIRVIEINPRFGGGAPLSIRAGANFPKWILQSLLGRKPRIQPDGFKDDVAMLRYDQSVFVVNASRRFDESGYVE